MMDTSLVLMDSARIDRSAKRMAYEIVELNKENNPIVLLGINERGYAVARLLEKVLGDVFEGSVETVNLLLEDSGSAEIELASGEASSLKNKMLVIVDDVIFSGQTIFQALQVITNKTAVREIHTAVMIDRGHRKFPIRAEFCGMELPTKVNEHVAVAVEGGKVKQVILERE